jgi:hypothetical protein
MVGESVNVVHEFDLEPVRIDQVAAIVFRSTCVRRFVRTEELLAVLECFSDGCVTRRLTSEPKW